MDPRTLFIEVPEGRTHLCPICKRPLRTLEYFREHIRKRHGATNFVLVCRVCKETFKDKRKTNHHLKEHDLLPEDPDLECTKYSWSLSVLTWRPESTPGSPVEPNTPSPRAVPGTPRAPTPPSEQATIPAPVHGGLPTGSPQAHLPPVPRAAPLSTPSSAASRGAQLLRAGRALRRRTPPALRRSPLMRHLLPSSPPQIVAAATPVTTPRGRPWEEVAAEAVALASTLSSPWALFTGSGAVAEALGAGAPPTTPSGRGAAPEAPGVATNTSADAAPRQVDPVLPSSQGVRRVSPPLSPPPGSTSAAGRSASSPLSSAPPTPEGFGALSPSSPSTQAPRPTAFQAKWLERLEEATSWADFEAAVAALTREMEPQRRAQQRRGPPPRRQQDPRRLQQLYRSSRAKAMRVVREEASPMCDLPAEEVAAHFEEVFSNRLPALSAAPEGAVLPPTQACDPSLVAPFTREEVLARLQHCSDTAPGPDVIFFILKQHGVPPSLISIIEDFPEVVFLPSWQGGANILPLSDLADIGAVTKAFKVLTCPDSLVRDIAESSATRTVTRYLGREAYPVDLAAYLSGCTDDGHSKSSATVWTAARSASRRLAAKIPGLCWEWSPTLSRMSIVVPLPGRSPDRNVVDCMSRSELHSTLRRGVQHHYHLQLAAKPDQGKVHDVAAREPTSNHFLAAGRFTRFCDWRFVHRARLGVLPLKACIRVPGADKVCRKCTLRPRPTFCATAPSTPGPGTTAIEVS
ncbi:hypothetical protein KUF71_017246 [Frankliniella fusca]|uniref:C2H2-type domain-containing protein n=1 Tax=Frankliniella fusca TaxID=407009 RepID=A0AAE1HWT8_9NEOP|nr:hypothetical protein KUF71_017246 [Frankliniella fusca]